ncbi:MAG: DUF554 domain-containing protein [Bacteroidales bacterium]|nr:DUF554 domain-containing protein [Bacteroidales bacterium]MBO7480387.1 DUF554 domain-containing protein [Bacteroidales bacterium]MBO7488058.1 DUF554 domain-containing protein [Bacteroidales bacterium]
MLGTIVNTCTIILGSVIGAQVHRGVKEKYKEAVYTALGLACLGIGLGATIRNMPNSEFPVLFVLAMAIGVVVGTWLNIDGRFHNLVDKMGKGKGASEDGRSSLAEGLSTACLLYCVGPLSMLGPMTSALQGDNTLLFTNATLDLVSSFIFASTYGIGMVLAAPVLFCWQGMFYLIAKISATAISDALMCELLIIGGLIITASGLSLLKIRQIKTLDMLPALLVPVLWFVGKWLFGLIAA